MKLLATVSLGALLLSAPAWAWDNTTNGNGPQSIADGGDSQSQLAKSRSVAKGGNATGGSVKLTIVNQAPAVTTPAATPTAKPANGTSDPSSDTSKPHHDDRTPGVRWNANSGGGGYDHVQLPVATADAPAIMSFNPCSGSSTSGAAQFAPFGFSFGTGGGFDQACRLHMLGKDKAAVAYLCRDNKEIRQAFKDIGEPCPQDAPPPVVNVAVVPPDQKYRYDYCLTASPGELSQHKECRASGL